MVTKREPEVGTGLLVENRGQERTIELGTGPVILGSSPRFSNVVIDEDNIAPEHARIWLRDGRYLIHHVGGMSRRTYVNGQNAEWLVLERGDVIEIGNVTFAFDDPSLPVIDEIPNDRFRWLPPRGTPSP